MSKYRGVTTKRIYAGKWVAWFGGQTDDGRMPFDVPLGAGATERDAVESLLSGDALASGDSRIALQFHGVRPDVIDGLPEKVLADAASRILAIVAELTRAYVLREYGDGK